MNSETLLHPGILHALEELRADEPCETSGEPYDLDRDATIKRIRAALKRRSGKDWSVKGGSGTAWGWIEIDVPPRRRTWVYRQSSDPAPPCEGAVYLGVSGVTPPYVVVFGAEDQILSPDDDPWAREAAESRRTVAYDWEHDAKGAAKFGHASPHDRLELGRLLGLGRPAHHQGESIAAGGDYRREYIDRAEGRTPTIHGTQYWD